LLDACAPFENELQWQRHQDVLIAERLPVYDRAVHAKPVRNKLISAITLIPATLIWLAILPMVSLLFLLPSFHWDG
jgi:hypothetical protein